MYVQELIGPEPEHDARGDDPGLQDPARSAHPEQESTRRQLADLEGGIDYDDVTDTLEREGVEKFRFLRGASRGDPREVGRLVPA
jgi:hypothetical protein